MCFEPVQKWFCSALYGKTLFKYAPQLRELTCCVVSLSIESADSFLCLMFVQH